MSIQGQEGTPSGSAEGPHPGGMGQELQEDVMERLKGYGGFLRFFFFFQGRHVNLEIVQKSISLLRAGFEPATYGFLLQLPTTVHRSTN